MKKAFDANVPRAKARYKLNFPPDFVKVRKRDAATVAVSRLATETQIERTQPGSPSKHPAISADQLPANPAISADQLPANPAISAAQPPADPAINADQPSATVAPTSAPPPRAVGQKLAPGSGMADKVGVPHTPDSTSGRRPGGERKPILPEIPSPSGSDADREAYSQIESLEEPPRTGLDPGSIEGTASAIERISVLERELAKLKTLDLSLEGPVYAARHQAEKASDEALSRMDEARRTALEMEEKARVLTDLTRELANLEAQKDQALIALDETHRTLVESLAEEEATAKELGEILAGIRRLTSIIARLAAMPPSIPFRASTEPDRLPLESAGENPRQ